MSRIRLTTTTIAVVLALGGSLGACSVLGEKTVPREELERGVRQLLEEQFPQQVAAVACDGGLSSEVGSQMGCTMETADGETVDLTVTATQADGEDVKYEVSVTTPSPTPSPSLT